MAAHATRIRIVIDSNAAAKMEQAVERLARRGRPAPGGGHRALPPDADADAAGRRESQPGEAAVHARSDRGGRPVDTAQSTRVRVLPASGSRGRALVVEDNAVNQEMARAMLDMLGFDVTTASNGRKACWPRPPIRTST